jgi:hypothetical protein
LEPIPSEINFSPTDDAPRLAALERSPMDGAFIKMRVHSVEKVMQLYFHFYTETNKNMVQNV